MEDVEDNPEFIRIDTLVSKEDIRDLLRELAEKEVSRSTTNLLASLALTPPMRRLTMSLNQMSSFLETEEVDDVLVDGLSAAEKKALLELDREKFSRGSRRTARGLLCVKERFIFAKRLAGLFRSARSNDGYLDVSDGDDTKESTYDLWEGRI